MNEAIKFFTQSAESGNSNAQSLLGSFYQYGQGVEKDLNKAIEWYEKSFEQGNEYAMGYLGNLYLNGEGVVKDIIRGYAYCAVSSALGIVASTDCQRKASGKLSEEELKQAKQLAKEMYVKYNPDVTAQ